RLRPGPRGDGSQHRRAGDAAAQAGGGEPVEPAPYPHRLGRRLRIRAGRGRALKLLPASLRGRYALLLVLLVLLGQLTAAVLLRQLVLRPRLAQAAESTAHTAQAI